jgi:D-arabinose 1-dehydrogenase-like Zn-dependent alcohol dehydrogenase
VNCRNQAYTGIQHDGGYAEVMIARGSGLISVPDDLKDNLTLESTSIVDRPS